MSLLALKRPLLQLKFEVRSLLAREPWLSLFHRPIVWWAQHKNRGIIDVRECDVGHDTEFVIDGFQGSGNSFATVAFKRSQPRSIRLAHHLHSPAQIIKAARNNIPTLVTIREPRGAAISLTSRWPYISLNQAVRGYVSFYEKIEPYAESFVISPFTSTTKHLDSVIREVNQRFGTEFVEFEYSEENMNALRNPKSLGSEKEKNRAQRKAEMAETLEKTVDKLLLNRAEQVYERLSQLGVQTPVDTRDES